MFIIGMLSWWYGAGWRQRVTILRERLANTIDYFSIDLLAKTLFAPFRQISAGKVNGPLGVKMHAFFDRILSRFIGMMIRSTMIVMGTCVIVMHCLLGAITVIVWAFVPILPLIGVLLFISGWVPWTL